MLYFLPYPDQYSSDSSKKKKKKKKKKNSQADYTNGNFYTEISNKQAFDFT